MIHCKARELHVLFSIMSSNRGCPVASQATRGALVNPLAPPAPSAADSGSPMAHMPTPEPGRQQPDGACPSRLTRLTPSTALAGHRP